MPVSLIASSWSNFSNQNYSLHEPRDTTWKGVGVGMSITGLHRDISGVMMMWGREKERDEGSPGQKRVQTSGGGVGVWCMWIIGLRMRADPSRGRVMKTLVNAHTQHQPPLWRFWSPGTGMHITAKANPAQHINTETEHITVSRVIKPCRHSKADGSR